MREAPDPLDPLLRLACAQERDHALILLDPAGIIVGWRMAAESVFGYPPEVVLGRHLDPLFVPEDRARGEPTLEREIAVRTGRAEDDRWSLRSDGSRFWSHGILTCLRDEDGTIRGFCKLVRDRTDLRGQLDTHLRRAEALEAQEARRGVFLATLAHELRTPLGALANASHLLGMGVGPQDEVALPVQIIDRQIHFIRRLVDDLFDNLRLGHGKVQLQTTDENLRGIVEHALESCRAMLSGAEQEVRLLFPPGEIALRADAVRLQQVFVNLLTNASKYSPRRSLIWVKGTVEGNEAVVRIEDLGRGIPKEILPRIFELFVQAEPLETGLPPGLGLGLSVVKSIVELHGGTVQARSEGVNRGTEMIVRLPLRRPT